MVINTLLAVGKAASTMINCNSKIIIATSLQTTYQHTHFTARTQISVVTIALDINTWHMHSISKHNKVKHIHEATATEY